MATEITTVDGERKWLLNQLICVGALPGHASNPNDFTRHFCQVLGKAGAIEYFSLFEWNTQSKRQETKR